MWDNLYSMRTTVCNTKTIPFWPICNCQAIKCQYFQATNWQKDIYFIYWNFLPEIEIEWFAFRGWLVNSRGGFGSLSSLISFFLSCRQTGVAMICGILQFYRPKGHASFVGQLSVL